MREITYSDTPVWQPFSALEELKRHTLASGDNLCMANWDAKYINARIDMRTGNVLLSEGNILCNERAPRYIVVAKD